MGYLNNSGLARFWNAIKSKFIRTINGIGPDTNGNVSVDTCEFVNGTQTAATGSFTGVSRDSSLYDGKHIIYRLPYAGSGNATLNLTLADGTTTGAKNVWRAPGTRLTTHYAAGNFLGMTYFQSDDSWHCDVDVDTDSFAYGVRLYYGIYKAKTAVYRYQIMLTRDEDTLLPVNAVDNNVGTTKQLTTAEFDPFGEIYWYWTTTVINAGSYIAGSNLLSQYWLVDLRYSFNTGTTLTAYKDVYLVCEPRPNGKAVLAPNPISQALPSSEDGYVYIRLGKAYDTYRITLDLHKPRYYYANGEIREWTNSPVDAKLAEYNTDEDVFQIRHAKAEKSSYNSEVVRKITGGTLAWNQLIEDGNFPSTAKWPVSTSTISASDNVLTVTKNENTGEGTGYTRPLSLSFIIGHKYFMSVSCKGVTGKTITVFSNSTSAGMTSIVLPDSNWHTITKIVNVTSSPSVPGILWLRYATTTGDNVAQFKDYNIIDLTIAFGSTIADRIYALEQATAGAGVAWFRRYFNRDYYEPAQTLAHTYFDQYETTGFNQYNGVPTIGKYWSDGTLVGAGNSFAATENKVRCIPNTAYCVSFPNAIKTENRVYITSFDAYGSFLRMVYHDVATASKYVFTTDSDCHMFAISFYTHSSTFADGNFNSFCINLSDASRNGQYEPYRHSRITFFDNPVLLRGIPYLDENDNLRFNGDTLEAPGKINRRYTVVDLGTLTWTKSSTVTGAFATTIPESLAAPYKYASGVEMRCGAYVFDGHGNSSNGYYGANGTIRYYYSASGAVAREVYITDVSKDLLTAAQFKAAMSGVMLVYPLETPTEEEFTPIDGPLVSDPLGLEVISKTDWDDTPILAQMDILYANEVRANVEMIATNKVIAAMNSGDNSSGVYYGTCSTAAATAEKAVVCEDFDITKLVPGAMITVKFLNTNSAAVGNLTLNVNFTVAKGIRYVYNGSYSTIPGAGYLKENQIYQFTYDGTYWVVQMMYNTNTTPYSLFLTDAKRVTIDNLYGCMICFTSTDCWSSNHSKIIPANTVNSDTGTSKTLTTRKFNPFGDIYYYSSTTAINANAVVGNSTLYTQTAAIDLRYSFNTGTTLVANQDVYLKCRPRDDDRRFPSVVLDKTSPIVQRLDWQDECDCVYIRIGVAFDNYRICLTQNKPVYILSNNKFRLWDGDGYGATITLDNVNWLNRQFTTQLNLGYDLIDNKTELHVNVSNGDESYYDYYAVCKLVEYNDNMSTCTFRGYNAESRTEVELKLEWKTADNVCTVTGTRWKAIGTEIIDISPEWSFDSKSNSYYFTYYTYEGDPLSWQYFHDNLPLIRVTLPEASSYEACIICYPSVDNGTDSTTINYRSIKAGSYSETGTSHRYLNMVIEDDGGGDTSFVGSFIFENNSSYTFRIQPNSNGVATAPISSKEAYNILNSYSSITLLIVNSSYKLTGTLVSNSITYDATNPSITFVSPLDDDTHYDYAVWSGTTITIEEYDIFGRIHNIPSGGSKDQVLTKNSATNYDVSWKTPTNTGLPTGGSLGQILAKKSATNYDTEWISPPSGVKIYNITYNSSTHTYALPDTFANVRSQFLVGNLVILSNNGLMYYLSEASASVLVFTTAVSDDYFVYRLEWLSSDTAIGQATELSLYNNYVPSGGTTGQFLVKKSNKNFDLQWVTVPNANGVSF